MGTIQTTNAGWGVNAFGPFVGNPANAHVVRMITGAAIGRQFRILSNTSDTLTVVSGTDLTGVASGDQYQIFATETLQSLFGGNGQINGQTLNTSGDSTLADNGGNGRELMDGEQVKLLLFMKSPVFL